MKIKSKTSLIMGIVFLMIIALFFWIIRERNDGHFPTNFTYVITPRKQTVDNRTWKAIKFHLVARTKKMSRPLNIRKGPQNNLFVTDYGDSKVKQFNLQGQLIRTFGKGPGKGPGEMINITSVAFGPSGAIWIADDPTSKIIVFKTDTFKTIYSHKIPARVLPIGKNRYMIQSRFSSRPTLKTRNKDEDSNFDLLVKQPVLWSYAFQSYFRKDQQGDIIRLNYYLNNIVRYDSSGHVNYFRQPIGSPQPPKYNRPKPNDLHIKFKSIKRKTVSQVSNGFSLVNNQIHILIIKRISDHTKRFMDVYSLQNGDYLYSYKLPAKLSYVAVTDHHIAGIPTDSTYVDIWEIKDGW